MHKCGKCSGNYQWELFAEPLTSYIFTNNKNEKKGSERCNVKFVKKKKKTKLVSPESGCLKLVLILRIICQKERGEDYIIHF